MKQRIRLCPHEELSPKPTPPPDDGEAEVLDTRVPLPYAPPLAVNPLTATDG
jgi:hypothetical protein